MSITPNTTTTAAQDSPNPQELEFDFGQCEHCGEPLSFADYVQDLASSLVELFDEDPESAVSLADFVFDEIEGESSDDA